MQVLTCKPKKKKNKQKTKGMFMSHKFNILSAKLWELFVESVSFDFRASVGRLFTDAKGEF